jgi:hypothetical protein
VIDVSLQTVKGNFDGDDDSTDIRLRETGVSTGVFESEPQLLMSADLPLADNPDDDHAAFSGFPPGAVNDDVRDDRTHRGTIDGYVRSTYVTPTGQFCQVVIPVCQRDPEARRILRVRATVFNEPVGVDISGDGVINTVLGPVAAATTFVDAQIARANAAWAQACIRVERVGAVNFVAAPAPAGMNIIADSSFNGGDNVATITAAIGAGGVAADVAELYFVPTSRAPTPSPTVRWMRPEAAPSESSATTRSCSSARRARADSTSASGPLPTRSGTRSTTSSPLRTARSRRTSSTPQDARVGTMP